MIYAANSMAAVLFLSGVLGAVYGVLYDVMRSVRDVFFCRRAFCDHRILSAVHFVIVFFSDILFFIFVGFSVSVFFFYTNDGIFRMSSVFVIIIGFCVYRVTLGRIICVLLNFLSNFFKKIVKISLLAIAFLPKSVYNILVKLSGGSPGSGKCSLFETRNAKGGDCDER